MKTIHKLAIFFLAVAFAACQSDLDDSYFDDENAETIEIVIDNGMIQSPKWLAHVIDSIGHTYPPTPGTGRLLYPWVYSVTHNEQDYILVFDHLESCWVCGFLFFTSSGEPIGGYPDDPTVDLYNALENVEDRTLLWRYQH